MLTDKWIKRFLGLAEHVAQWSKDPSTKTGAVITAPDNRIISLAYNGFPQGVQDDPQLYENRSAKYERIIHSEVNAVLMAGRPLDLCVLYCWPLMPCARCATVIIQAGISTVVFPYMEKAEVLDRFKESHEHSIEMFTEADVNIICFDD